MKEKVYKPIMSDGDHLVKSKKNEGRVRGISQNENNQTTDIVEWEEVEIERQSDDCGDDFCELQYPQETESSSDAVEAFVKVIAAIVVIHGLGKLNKHVIQPWWHDSANPWICSRISEIKSKFSGEAKTSESVEEGDEDLGRTSMESIDKTNSLIDSTLDREFENQKVYLSPEEAEEHVLKLVYHMLEVACELKIIANSKIVEWFDDENTRLESQENVERHLSEKVADTINSLLSRPNLQFEMSTSKQLLDRLGGGIEIDGKYIPVEAEKVGLAINEIKRTNNFEKQQPHTAL